MEEFCNEHSGLTERLNGHDNKIEALEKVDNEQWTKINKHGEDISGMKRDIRICMVLLIGILLTLAKLAFWPV
jgi:hypothetical protein